MSKPDVTPPKPILRKVTDDPVKPILRAVGDSPIKPILRKVEKRGQ